MRRSAPALLLLAWSAWLASAYLLSGEASYIRQHDTAEVNTPYYTALPVLKARHLAGFRDPLAGTGVDALANLKGDMPLVEAFFQVIPHWSSSGVLLLAQTAVAALGLYLLLRRRLGASEVPALIAAGWFALLPAVNVPYSGYPTWYGFYVSGLPWALMALSVSARPSVHLALAAAAGAGLALGTPAASGLPVLLVAALWVAVFPTASGWRFRSALVVVFSTAFLLVKLPTLVALLANAPESHRIVRAGLPFGVNSARELWLGRLSEARETVAAYVVPVAVALAAWILGGFRRRSLDVALGAIVALVVVTIATPLLQTLQGGLGTVFRSYQIDRINRFMPVFVCAACGLGLEFLREKWTTGPAGTRRRRAWALGYVVSIAALIIPLAALSIRMNGARETYRVAGNRYDAFFHQPALEALGRRAAAGELFRVVTFADRNAHQYGQHAAFAWAYGLETADVYGTTYPYRYHEFWRRVIDPVRRARPEIRDYFDRWGNMAYLFNPAWVLFDPMPEGASPALNPVPFNLSLLSLANVRYVISRVPLEDPRLKLQTDGSSELRIYENDAVLPRFFVVHDWRGFPAAETLLDAIAAADAGTLRSTAMIDRENAGRLGVPSARPDEQTTSQTVEVTQYEADRIGLRVRTGRAGLLVATNNYSRHWKATVDGKAAPVIPAYHTFQGVPVGPGEHTVSLSYEPPQSAAAMQPLALGLAVVALAGAASWAGARRDA